MIGLFLPRLRVVSLLNHQQLYPVPGRNSPRQLVTRGHRSGPLALIRNNEQDGSGDVSAYI
ncbi:hypothetical protein FHS21_000890 [Phyllobacterium trifolii]|jgi:hypothetical protein|uniref:Uncharacterized protein n=1 Tax=Phyllobacterium trifolii TaxID=300193 RepID=A0A839U358_9HYPH|nr:hypothetical protein [Phyllobacterium trifolii]MBB3144494.1 hypothetical protein [Phyllobacterium trifolii]